MRQFIIMERKNKTSELRDKDKCKAMLILHRGI